jgi:hypothetical protein
VRATRRQAALHNRQLTRARDLAMACALQEQTPSTYQTNITDTDRVATTSVMSTKPLKSALKSSKTATGASTDASASSTAGDVSSASTAADAAASAARIRAAAEVKATQLHQTVRAQEQWREWISKVQMKLIEPAVSTRHTDELTT